MAALSVQATTFTGRTVDESLSTALSAEVRTGTALEPGYAAALPRFADK